MNVDLPFVVGGAAAEEIAIADGGFKSGRGPEIERLSGLHVVVPVEKDGGLAGRFERFGVDERVHVGRNDFDFFETSGAQFFGNPVGGALDVRLMLTLGTNARDAQEFAKLCKVLLVVVFDEFSKIHGWMPSELSMIAKRGDS
jgi:hypothetical protein